MPSRLWSLPVFRLIATDRCRVAAPWFVWAHVDNETAMLRSLAAALERSKFKGVTALEQVVAAIAYLPSSLFSIVAGFRQWGRALASVYGISPTRQVVQLATYAWRLGACPRMYYHLRLHRHSWKQTGRYFIDQPELHHLQRHISPRNIDALENKLQFSERAQRAGLPIVPILAQCQDGNPPMSLHGNKGSVVDLPSQNIFVKPAAGYSSFGVMGFRFDSTTSTYSDESARVLTKADLTKYLAEASRGRILLIQPWLENHPDLRGFSTAALCNFRIVTGRAPDGCVKPVMAAFRFPWRSLLSCAEPGITLCASIDLATGTLKAAEAKEPSIGRLSHHPVTGQQIEGFTIGAWNTLLATATTAHGGWPEFPFVGWDIVVAETGVFILEGSCLWGGTLAQMSGGEPLGLTVFPSIYLANLAARQASLVQ